jgi:N-acetylglucosaminyldiphosphoundecaprenol N-acetyl-beta-D-mannosaminyltransferase
MDALLRQALIWSKEEKPRTIAYANVHVLNTAYRDEDLLKFINKSDLVYCDGEGVRLGAYCMGQNIPERLTGADWILPLARHCEKEGVRLYFLGSEMGVASRAAEKINSSFPGICIAAHHGYLADPSVSSAAVEQINDFEPGILLVGMGTPVQERWIEANRTSLKVPVVWAVGALFDFVAGTQTRGPELLVSHGMEWACRLWSDPRRLWKRYVVGNPLFFWRVMRSRWNNRGRSES